MLRVLGSPAQLCDSITRREVMRVGGLSLFAGASGLTLPRLLAANEEDRGQVARAPVEHLARARRQGERRAKDTVVRQQLGGGGNVGFQLPAPPSGRGRLAMPR